MALIGSDGIARPVIAVAASVSSLGENEGRELAEASNATKEVARCS